MEVLGLQDQPKNEMVFSEFKDQLVRKGSFYETGLLWKVGHPKLSSNKQGSLGRLSNLLRKLNRNPEINDVIQDQIEPKRKEFYIPHKPIIKNSAESTKLRIVYDASAKGGGDSPSLNDCLETGPSMQNLLWDIIISNRFKPIALTGYIKQAFCKLEYVKIVATFNDFTG